MAGPEARLRTRIVKKLNMYGNGFWFVIHETMYGQNGISDILGVYNGQFWALEVKMPGKEHTLTERQARFLKMVRKMGGHGAVVTSVDQACSLVFGSPSW